MARRWILLCVLATLSLGSGCRHFNKNKKCDDCRPRPDGFLDPPAPPRDRDGLRIPPPSIPSSPSDLPETRYRYGTPPPPTSIPAKPRTSKPELLLPEAPPPGLGSEIPLDSRSSLRGFLDPPLNGPAPRTTTSPKSTADKPDPVDSSVRPPLGLPGFTRVPSHEGCATGQRPTLDGFASLKTQGFRTVVYLHAPSANLTAARDLAEKQGLKFVPLEVTPANLRTALDSFAAILAESSQRPLYVSDEDGTRAGALWYLVFRTQDYLSDDAARLRATPLGLGEPTSSEHQQYWIAIQRILANR